MQALPSMYIIQEKCFDNFDIDLHQMMFHNIERRPLQGPMSASTLYMLYSVTLDGL